MLISELAAASNNETKHDKQQHKSHSEQVQN